MTNKPNTQIIIRHTAGTKINRIDPFTLSDTNEITFGRAAGSSIVFDSAKDDVVSRHHAVIRIKNEGVPSFIIEDLKSSNGTFVNSERLSEGKELLPDDTVEFGQGGPKFTFDIQPRPEGMAARTRVMSAIEATATRAVSTTAFTSLNDPMNPTAETAKRGVGKNTVMMMLSDERKKTSQVWMGALAAVTAFFMVGGGALYWNNLRAAERVQLEAQEQTRVQTEKVRADAASATQQLTQQIGMGAGDVVNKFGNSTVWISFTWRLFDKETGRPVFHKNYSVRLDRKTVRNYPAYIKMGDGSIVPWLTTEDEDHKNYELKSGGTGSGFVISENGFILTNKHVAAAWMIGLSPDDYLPGSQGVLLSVGNDGKLVEDIIPLSSLPANVSRWVPGEQGARLFAAKIPTTTNAASFLRGDSSTLSNTSTLFGKNETLEVRFPGSALSINATNVRQSTMADAALIKIESPQALTPIELADAPIKVGEKVTVLGYPGVSTQTIMEMTTTERGQVKSRLEVIPEPTVTEGIISKLGMELTQAGAATLRGNLGDAFQLSVNSTGAGNSGGPVFNSAGKVVGLYTYGRNSGGAQVSYAVPISHGRDLLNPQRTQ